MRPLSIDLPQRFGADAMGRIDPGESFVRAEWFGARIDFSHARRFWGPGVRHALLLSAQSPRFPHIAIGTAGPLRTILGTFDAELLYARLDQSDWSPPSAATRRFGTGFRAAWTPPRVPLQVGTARFYHRAWPESFTARDLLAPFGSLFYDEQLRAGGPEDNQLASIFFHLSARRAMLELFGEFGRNDRSVDLRDFIVEPEHNSAWLLGVMKVFSLDSAARRFWSVRYEAANGRIPPLQDLQRGQTTFFEHAPLNQGHTHRGALLGSPLLDRSGGSELAVNRWDSAGRIGASIFQRQMPPDILVGMPRDRTRSQWDVRVSALRFFGLSELSGQIGYVWDLNRFANKDVGNVYVAAGWRRSIR
jgi:hypothetical protein